jgi:hypothetical protein
MVAKTKAMKRKRKSSNEQKLTQKKVDGGGFRKKCTFGGCTNHAQEGGVYPSMRQ